MPIAIAEIKISDVAADELAVRRQFYKYPDLNNRRYVDGRGLEVNVPPGAEERRSVGDSLAGPQLEVVAATHLRTDVYRVTSADERNQCGVWHAVTGIHSIGLTREWRGKRSRRLRVPAIARRCRNAGRAVPELSIDFVAIHVLVE